MKAALIKGFVRRIYALDLSEEAWLSGLSSSAEEAFGSGLGTFAVALDGVDPSSTRPRSVACTGLPGRGAARRVEEAFCTLRADDLRELARRPPAVGVGDVTLAWREQAHACDAFTAWLGRFGAQDLMTLLATDPSGVTVVVGTNLRRKKALTWRSRATLSRLAAHTAAARRLRDSTEEIDATYDAEGRVLEARSDADEPQIARKLRDAVLSLCALRHDGGEVALTTYTSRIDARWSVLTQFSRDGREYVVARRNAPASWPIAALTEREREVVCHLAVGRSQKEIAYELGIAPSTVRVLSARSARKLGARTSKELAERARALSMRP